VNVYNVNLSASALWPCPTGEKIDTVGVGASGIGLRLRYDGVASASLPPGFLQPVQRIVANKPWVAPGLILSENGLYRAYLEQAQDCNYTYSLFRYQDKVDCLLFTCPKDVVLAIQVVCYVA
jgi:hypothetical protein